MMMRIFYIVCVTIVLGGCAAVEQSKWPDSMASLQPGISVSPVASYLPANTKIMPPEIGLPPTKAMWSGIWIGYACSNKNCDIKLAVEKVTNEGASIIYSFASDQNKTAPPPRRFQAKFSGDELQADLSGGASVTYRMRKDGNIDFLWRQGEKWVSGILSRTEKAADPKEDFKKAQVFINIDGTVQAIDNNIVEIIANIPEADTSNLPFVEKVSQRIINRSVLLENDEILIQNQSATIIEMRKNVVKLRFEESPKVSIGSKIVIGFRKHIIAISEFDVIRGHDKSIGNITMSSLMTSLVESGHFNVVEREKIKAVLRELQFSDSGLTDVKNASKVGKLIGADIILTGTFADMGGSWNVNLRLINVSTGMIVAALEEKASFKEFKPEAVRDPSNYVRIDSDYYSGWQFGYKEYTGETNRRAFIDNTTSIEGSKGSIRVDYQLGKSSAVIDNIMKRDWSLYSGIEFYVKSDHEEVLRFRVLDSNKKDDRTLDEWQASYSADTDWKMVRIYFNNMSLYDKSKGDGVLSLDLVEIFSFYASPHFAKPGTKGTFWIDGIKLF